MFEQPDKTANLSLTYERFGLFVRFSYNLRGSYLDSVYTGDDIGSLMLIGDGAAAFDRFVGKTERYDLTVRYNITRQLQVFAEAINLFNNEVEEYLGERSRLSMVRYTEPVYSIGAKFVW
jgi:outer membrane receptor protein involved in Fe transport